VLIQDNEGDFVSILALVLLGLTTIFWLIDMFLNMSVRIWAAKYLAENEEESLVWSALSEWNREYIPTIYLYFGYLATALFGLVIASANLLPDSLGWVVVIWSTL